MLNKIIKYDFKSINKPLFILYAITILSSLINIATNNSGSNDVLSALFMLSTDIALIFFFLSLFFSIVVCFWNFRETFFKDEAYLTHTLPIDRKTIYDGKIIVSLITIFIALITTGCCFIFVFSHLSLFEFIEKTYIQEGETFKTLIFCIITVLQFFMFFLSIIDGLIIGYKFNKRKDLMSLIFALLIVLFAKSFSFIIVHIFKENMWDIIDIIITILVNIILYITGRVIVKKGIDLE